MTAKLLHLVRHGHVEGRRQAAAAAEHLRGRPVVHVYSGPLERATATAAAIAAACGAPVAIDDDLVEPALEAHWEGLRWSEVRTRRHAELDAYLHRPHEVAFAELGQRMARALRALAGRHPGEEAAVVAHGDPIKAAVCHLTGTPIAEMHSIRVPTAAVVALDLGATGVRIVERRVPAGMAKR